VNNFVSELIIGYNGSNSKLLTYQAMPRDKKAEGARKTISAPSASNASQYRDYPGSYPSSI